MPKTIAAGPLYARCMTNALLPEKPGSAIFSKNMEGLNNSTLIAYRLYKKYIQEVIAIKFNFKVCTNFLILLIIEGMGNSPYSVDRSALSTKCPNNAVSPDKLVNWVPPREANDPKT